MPRSRTLYVCGDCGASSPNWVGRCPACRGWGTLVEERAGPARPRDPSVPTGVAQSIAQVSVAPSPTVTTGIGELDRVLGGGLVSGSATLLGGFWLFATRELLRQDGLSMPTAMRELRKMRSKAKTKGEHFPKPIFGRVFVRGIREYLRPGFHPNDKAHDALIRATRARLEAEGVIEGV